MSPFTPALRLHDRYVLRERIGLGGMSDIHMCTTPSPAPPHGPGVVIDGSKTVLVNFMPQCRLGDTVLEPLGPPNKIVKGEMTVLVGG